LFEPNVGVAPARLAISDRDDGESDRRCVDDDEEEDIGWRAGDDDDDDDEAPKKGTSDRKELDIIETGPDEGPEEAENCGDAEDGPNAGDGVLSGSKWGIGMESGQHN